MLNTTQKKTTIYTRTNFLLPFHSSLQPNRRLKTFFEQHSETTKLDLVTIKLSFIKKHKLQVSKNSAILLTAHIRLPIRDN